jgi:hypothetical protein
VVTVLATNADPAPCDATSPQTLVLCDGTRSDAFNADVDLQLGCETT